MPGGPLTLLQIAIGIVDLSLCALAMYMLMPDEPHIGFVTLAVIFVSATLLGFASHAPGGIGVFDAAMLVALWQFDKEICSPVVAPSVARRGYLVGASDAPMSRRARRHGSVLDTGPAADRF